MATKIQLRRDTTVNWAAGNPVLAEGEIGIDLTLNRMKVGDGAKTWALLPYTAGDGAFFIRTGTVLSPATAGDQVHAGTGKLTVGGAAAAPNIEIKADGGIVANTDGLVYDAATKRLGIGSATPGATGVDTGATQLFVVAPNSNFGPAATFITDSSGRGVLICDQAKTSSLSFTVNSTVGAMGTSASNIPLVFTTGAVEKARITGFGQLLVGTSTVLNASAAKLQCTTTANITTATYPDNATALAGGLVAGDIYRKADGTLMITF
jgi:hypothetical protein